MASPKKESTTPTNPPNWPKEALPAPVESTPRYDVKPVTAEDKARVTGNWDLGTKLGNPRVVDEPYRSDEPGRPLNPDATPAPSVSGTIGFASAAFASPPKKPAPKK